MTSEHSPIIDFYPTEFKTDLNGKRYAWQGVSLLPFVDEKRLLGALDGVSSVIEIGDMCLCNASVLRSIRCCRPMNTTSTD